MSVAEGTEHCPLCRARETRVFFESRLQWGVRSDWTPVQAGATVLRCLACAHLFKPSRLVLASSDYADYHVWGDSPDQDKVDFSGGKPVARSQRLLSFLEQLGIYDEKRTRILDYGCNRGAFLALLKGAGHAGFDLSEHYRPVIEALGCAYFTPESLPPERSFDLLSLIHVVEHLEHPGLAMAPGLRALREGAGVLVQVPDIFTQPTDLYVMDHFHHFTPSTLAAAMGQAGLGTLWPAERVLAGEWTGIFGAARAGGGDAAEGAVWAANRAGATQTGPLSGRPSPAGHSPTSPSEETFSALAAELARGESELLQLKSEGTECVIFGAGIWGVFLASVLRGQVRAFVDDQPGLHGRELLGLPIQAPESIAPGNVAWVVGVPPSVARSVASRCTRFGHRTVMPFGPV